MLKQKYYIILLNTKIQYLIKYLDITINVVTLC